MMNQTFGLHILSAFFLLLLNACALSKQTTEIKNIFLEDVDTSKRVETLPFTHSWEWRQIPSGKYKAIKIEEFKLDSSIVENWSDSKGALISSKESYLEESKSIAKYCHKRLIKEIEQDSSRNFSLSNTAGAGVVRIETVLTEVQFSRPIAHAGTSLIPLPGTGIAASTLSSPYLSFAMRITDSQTGELLATIADRKFPPVRIIDFNKLTVGGALREICDNWSVMLSETFSKGHKEPIASRGRVAFLSW